MIQLLCIALLAGTALAAEDRVVRYARPELLIEPAELARPAVAGKVRLLDARPKAKYEAGHIPGAVWVDAADWSKAFNAEREPDAWACRLGELGIRTGSTVVIYDDALSKDAARIWWILSSWGVEDARLLNGGWRAWLASGGESDKKPPVIETVKPELRRSPSRVAKKDDVLEVIRKKDAQIIDARSEGEYCGTESMAKRGGSIPGAIHLEWSDLLDRKTQQFKSAAEIRKLFREAGIDVSRPSVTYCQSGGRAAVMAFTLELMGGKEVRNYYRSWAEWGNDAETPVVKPSKKK